MENSKEEAKEKPAGKCEGCCRVEHYCERCSRNYIDFYLKEN